MIQSESQSPLASALPTGRVAVITRTKNRPIMLRRALASVTSQTFKEFIHVVVNDGGEPGEVDGLVHEFYGDSRQCLVLHNEVSLGMEGASNRGIKSCASDFVVIHDDDDSWHPDYLREAVAFLESSEAYGIVSEYVVVVERIVDDQIIIDNRYRPPRAANSPTLFNIASLEDQFPPIAFTFRRAVFDEIGYYDERLRVLGDWDFNLRFLQKHDIVVLNKPLAYYHQRQALATGEYSNTVIAGVNLHKQTLAMRQNELLRADLEAGKFGIGTLVAIAHQQRESIKGIHIPQPQQIQCRYQQPPPGLMYRIARKMFRMIPDGPVRRLLSRVGRRIVG